MINFPFLWPENDYFKIFHVDEQFMIVGYQRFRRPAAYYVLYELKRFLFIPYWSSCSAFDEKYKAEDHMTYLKNWKPDF